jgi:hypothetical protein
MIQKAERNDQKMAFFGFYFNTTAKQKSFLIIFETLEKKLCTSPRKSLSQRETTLPLEH